MSGRERSQAATAVSKHSLLIAGHATSISLEDAFWTALKDIAAERGATPANLVAEIDSARRMGNLSSAIRVFVLDHYRRKEPSREAPAP